MNSRSGVCVCGFPVADHFGKRGRKRSCEDVLRLAVLNGTAVPDAPLVDIMADQLQRMAPRPLRLVKSDRRPSK